MAMQKILTALESNEDGKHVWQVASRFVKNRNAESLIINVIKPATSVYTDLDFAPIAGYLTDWVKLAKADNLGFLQELTGLDDEALLVLEGNPATEIANAVKTRKPDLLVIGVHNRRGLHRLLGSTTHSVLNATDCNVLAVHPDSGDQAYKKVLIAVEPGDLMTKVLEHAASFTNAAKVKILSVVPPLTQAFAELTEEIKQQTQAKVDAAVTACGFSTKTVELHIGDPKAEILAAAKTFNADLIIMGSSNRGAINRMLLGSTARGVLNRTPCDVMICRHA